MWSLLAKTFLPSVFATVDRVISGKEETHIFDHTVIQNNYDSC
jgi:hypothetical protein